MTDGFAPILTDRLMIRLLDERDALGLFDYRNLPEVYRYQAWKPESIESVTAFAIENSQIAPFQPGNYTQFAICLRGSDAIIGDVGIIYDADGCQAEVGFSLSPRFHGKGYAIEAVRAMMDYLFTKRALHRLYASVDPDNGPSIRLLEKLGFRFEAHFIKSYRMRGGWYDDVIYGILDEEWPTVAGS